MGNCLITKLKGTINNSEVPYYGELSFKFGQGTENNSGVASNLGKFISDGVPFDVYEGTNKVAENVTVFNGTPDFYYYVVPKSDNMALHIVNKYNVSQVYVGNRGITTDSDNVEIDLSKMQYINGMQSFYGNQLIGANVFDFGKIGNNISTQTFSIHRLRENAKFIIPEDFKFNSSLYNIEIYDLDHHYWDLGKVYGSILSLRECVNLNYVDMHYCPNLSGNINDLLTALYENGKTSGTLAIRIAGTQCVFNGQILSREYCSSIGKYAISATFTANGYTADFIL